MLPAVGWDCSVHLDLFPTPGTEDAAAAGLASSAVAMSSATSPGAIVPQTRLRWPSGTRNPARAPLPRAGLIPWLKVAFDRRVSLRRGRAGVPKFTPISEAKQLDDTHHPAEAAVRMRSRLLGQPDGSASPYGQRHRTARCGAATQAWPDHHCPWTRNLRVVARYPARRSGILRARHSRPT